MDSCRNFRSLRSQFTTGIQADLPNRPCAAKRILFSGLAGLSLAAALLPGGLALAQSAGTTVTAAPGGAQGEKAATGINEASPNEPRHDALPPRPAGNATVIGGKISKLDAVRDQFVLRIYGGQSMKVLFDARTHLYRDGVRAAMQTLHAGEAASVETSLDGTTVFADAIHILSQVPEGSCAGQVMAYDAQSATMTMRCDLTQEVVRFAVVPATVIEREGQATQIQGQDQRKDQGQTQAQSQTQGHLQDASLSDASVLVKGALVAVTFQPDGKANSIATHIRVSAVPGMTVVFTGDIISLDRNAGRLVVDDDADDRNYDIAFAPAQFADATTLSPGMRVKVTALFDGKGYTASTIDAVGAQ